MPLSKKQELSILFEPGSYFHSDYTPYKYHEIPDMLKKIANHRIITSYGLMSPSHSDLSLPFSMLKSWYSLPKVALLLGVLISDIKKIVIESPWIVTHKDYLFISKLCDNDKVKLKLTYQSSYEIADFIALGATQLKIFISLFSTAFSHRFIFIFSKRINNLIDKYNMSSLIIPGNFIERVCLYAENGHK